MSRCLYHYCSLDTFVAIISNKCLRLSDIGKSNDYMERKWILGVLEDALMKSFSDNGISIDLREDYWYGKETNSHYMYLTEMLSGLSRDTSYMTCFSRNGDLLSQWRAYGDDGKGISIGFNSDLIDKAKSNKHNVRVEDILYELDEQVDEIQYIVGNAIRYMKELFEENIARVSDNWNEYFIEEFDAFCEVVCDGLEDIGCFMKNPAFKEEDEVRIIYSPDITDDCCREALKGFFSEKKKFNNYVLNPVEYYARNDQLIGCADLMFDKLVPRDIITEIIIGPSSKVTDVDIFFLLGKYSYNAHDMEIKNSKASYRSR